MFRNSFSRGRVPIKRVCASLLLMPPLRLLATDPPAPPTVGANILVNDILGPDGVSSGLTVDECVFRSDCDDDRSQNEISISIHPLDRDVLLAAWNDAARTYLQPGNPSIEGDYGIGFAVSDDGGTTWLRLDRTGPTYPCEPQPIQFVPGHAFTRTDLCPSPGDSVQGDPATAMSSNDYLYMAGLSAGLAAPPYFARMNIDPSLNTGWETTTVPAGPGGTPIDKPYISADPWDDGVYVHWASGGGSNSTVRLSASRCAGCDFFEGSIACTCDDPSVVVGRQIAFLPSPQVCSLGVCTWGTASVVGPDGDLHIIWKHWGGASDPSTPVHDQVDQIRYRRATWVGDDLEFDPPLPGSDPNVKCEPPNDLSGCERGIIFGQPGYAEGFRRPEGHLTQSSVNFGLADAPAVQRLSSHPSIAVDPNDPAEVCGRGGTLYVVYAAEEPPGGATDPGVCDISRRVDMNVYVVRSRDGGATWSAPIHVPADTVELPPEVCDGQPFEQEEGDPPLFPVGCGRHSPFQFFPWISVDGHGRVAVMMYDTTPDHNDLPDIEARCTRDNWYRIQFAYSLDGGVTWYTGITISEADSSTLVHELVSPILADWVVFLGDYGGMTATADAGPARGVFHPIWTDLRDWDPRKYSQVYPGDVYTAAVEVNAPVFRMGDYDRDGDVDMDDFSAIAICAAAGTPIPALCEILDFDRDNVVDKDDTILFEQCRTGKLEGSMGGSDPQALEAMVSWSVEALSPVERSQQAEEMRQAAPTFDEIEAADMQTFADEIDPQ